MQWTREELVEQLDNHGLKISKTKEINHGIQFILRGGTIINHYTTGTIYVQGTKADPIEKEIATRIFNGKSKDAIIYFFPGYDKASNEDAKKKLIAIGLPFHTADTNRLMI